MTLDKPVTPSDPADQPHTNGVRGWLLQGIGWVCVLLGLAGIPLPLLPTTPFLLLAGACFIRSSPALHRRMLEDPRIGPYLSQWNRDRSIPRAARRRAFLLVIVSFSVSIIFVDHVGLRLTLGLIGAGLLLFLSRLKAKDEGPLVAPNRPITPQAK